jgi:hypothetical protein
LVNGNGKHRDYVIDASLADASVNIERNVSIMNRTSRFAVTALVALLAGAPVAVFAQTTSPGTPGAATGPSMSGSSTANPGMGTTAAPNSSVNAQSGAANMQSTGSSGTYDQGYNGQAGMNTGSEQQLSQNTLEDVQQQLQQQGFYRTGKVDGRWGPQTRQAVLSFQQSKGLQATGQLDQQTLDALGVNKQGG